MSVPVHHAIAKVAEYVISSPTGFKTASGWFHRPFRDITTSATTHLIDSLGDDAEKLVRLSEDDVQRLRATGLVVERNAAYRHYRHPVLDRFQQVGLSDSGTKQRISIRVMDHYTRQPISNVEVSLILDLQTMSGFRDVTNADGECDVIVPIAINQVPMVAFVPAKDYWSLRLEHVGAKELNAIALKPLPPCTPEIYDWGHGFGAMVDGAADGGSKVTVGIIDTGVRRDHPDLSPVGGLNCVFGQDASDWHDDRDGHGSHCAGVIAALMNEFGIKGYVPGAHVLAYRVFREDGAAYTYDIVKALQRAASDGCDIISMSLGFEEAQIVVGTQIERAYERGILSVAAAGNAGLNTPHYPAGFPLVTGVGAFGRLGTYPEDSLHRESESSQKVGDEFFFANFSNFGDQVVKFCAPGVAIRSSVPGGYAVMDGTSMACPHIAGIAALALASHPEILHASRDADRVERLLELLRGAARPLGFGPEYEGAGFPNVERILAM